MFILLHFKNIAKLLLIGAVLFIICSAVSTHAAKCTAAKNKTVCQADLSMAMFAQADRQIRPESPDYLFVGDACVKASVPPVAVTPKVMAAIVGDGAGYDITKDDTQKTIVEYETEQNDTLSSIAEKFNLNVDTIAWANDLSRNATLKSGQKMIIPPVDGIIHYVVSGDTMSKISQKYGTKTEEIIAFNELEGENDVFIGDVLVVPGGKMPKPVVATKPATPSVAESTMPIPNGYFLCPVTGCKRSQGLHFRSAVDLTAGYCGAPVYAAASGTVEKAKYGWNGGAGNNISISHLDGAIITHYYHLQSLSVTAGQIVKKGDVIGLMGSTGKSTGCHLHFEVIGVPNPFTK